MRCMIVFETAMEALMAHAFIAVAIAWKLSKRFRDLSGGLVGFLCDSEEPLCREGWLLAARARRRGIMRRDGGRRRVSGHFLLFRSWFSYFSCGPARLPPGSYPQTKK